MNYKEVEGNLFDAPQGYCLAHCIAGDFGMSAGIATQFNDIFDMRNRLINEYGDMVHPNCIKVDNVYNLITKEKSWHKPTYEHLTDALELMKENMVDCGAKKLAIPQIGCGLDGLRWNIVKLIIQDVFRDTDISIVVYIYNPQKEETTCCDMCNSIGIKYYSDNGTQESCRGDEYDEEYKDRVQQCYEGSEEEGERYERSYFN